MAHAVDFALSPGSPVYACHQGIVAEVVTHYLKGGSDEKLRTRANRVCVYSGSGYYSRYVHLKGACVEEGDQVERGQLIGYSGNSGYSTGPHLHLVCAP